MRYVNLSNVLVFRLISRKVENRFPDYESLINAKLMLPSEVKRMRKCERATPHEFTCTPLLWAMKLLQRARSHGKVTVIQKILQSYSMLRIIIHSVKRNKLIGKGCITMKFSKNPDTI